MAMSSRRVPGISQLPVHGSTMHDDGENAMEKQWTEQDLHSFVQAAQAVFDGVSLTEEQPEPGWQDESLQVDYELRGGRVDCVLRRCVMADGKVWQLQMTAPLAGNDLPEDRMTPREREMCRDDMNHDFVTGVFNRRYYETEFCTKLDEWTDCHRCAALALVSIDGAEKLSARESDAVMGQLVCFVANQWKKHFDRPAERVVCRLADSLFVIGCADKNCKELEEELHTLYGQMPHECVASVGLMKMVPIPQSIAVACTSEVPGRNREAVFHLCLHRLDAVHQAGGDQLSQT